MEDKVMFKVYSRDFYDGTFTLPVLKIFSENTGCHIYIQKVGIVKNGIFESFCHDDKLCKPNCKENDKCHVKNPRVGGE